MLSARQFLESEIIDTDKGLVSLNEVYFGKIPQLLMIEELFDKFKLAYRKLDISSPAKFRVMIKDPILKNIERKIAETFGFKDVHIVIEKSEQMNAYTVPFQMDKKGMSYDVNDIPFDHEKLSGSVIMTNNGFKFESKKFNTNLLVCLFYGILFKSNITTPELVAILLHEIGHNFSKVIYKKKDLSGRVDEKFADNFAAMYGYSEQLISAFSKMSINYSSMEKSIKKIPILGGIVGINRILNDVLYRTMLPGVDPHPTMHTRMMNLMKELEFELKNDESMSPTMKKDIEGQIQRSKMLLDKYYNGENEDLSDTMLKKYNKYIQPNHPGEIIFDTAADQKAAPNQIHARINKIYHKKGFFR